MAEKHNWQLNGTYFETCNCETACPCVWFNPPSEGDCKLFIAWHIDTGHFNDLPLEGLNVGLACFSPGHMKDGNWQVALYLDERANQAQQKALTTIYGGKVGGHLAVLMSFVGEVLGVKTVPMEYKEEGKKRSLVIPHIAAAEIKAIEDTSGREATITNPPLCVVPSHPAVVARSKKYTYQDFTFNWEISDRNGYFSPFTYQP
ncbi:DUF1326 domain-containing protein [Nitrosococcus wardiae]|uniref:DUF1326 domain-containing protein n=1 Tax=Nitrosococcus wardiae TaxID=1814290 RepID=A0A4P7BYV0_9GAMM|nr:DUF1326 domain-containing protein [Nitrosococcus wardiae]QBQ55368.1 DUF1326 domain-containing protein [Nitrosococcus wardiae]